MAAETERLSVGAKFAYGLGELGPAMAGSTLVFFLLIFLTDVAGLEPALAGWVLLIAKIWDAVSDPLIGWLTDKTETRWGRRLPWIVCCAIPFALTFCLHWIVPFHGSESDWALFWFYAAAAVLMNTFYTGVLLPHAALTPELTHDYDERTRLVGCRQVFSLAGSVGGLVVGLLVFHFVRGEKTVQYAVFGCVIGAIIVLSIAGCVFGIAKLALLRDKQRLKREEMRKPLPIGRQMAIVLQNKPFLIVCVVYLCSWIAVQFTASILPFYTANCLGMSKTDFYFVALIVQITALALLPVWGWVATHRGKKTAYFAGMALWIVAQCGLLTLGEGQLWLMYLLALLAGCGVSVAYFIPFAMLPDVIELDELETGMRREGVFYGFVVFLQKTGLALAQFVVAQVLAAAGYIASGPEDAAPVQPESALFAIRIAIGPLPALALLVGVVFVILYPITKQRHAEICRALEANIRARAGRQPKK